jgi:hypothetical protein
MRAAPYILALDVSKRCTGICYGRAGDAPRFMSVRGNDMETVEAMLRLGKWLIEFTKVEKPDFLFLEAAVNPAAFMGSYNHDKGKVEMSSNPETTIALAKMAGTVEFVAGMKGIATRLANVQTCRRAFIGSGNLKGEIAKPRVMAMCRALGWDPKNTDESDAGAVWYWATMQVSPRLYTPITPMMHAKVATEIDTAMAARKGRRA